MSADNSKDAKKVSSGYVEKKDVEQLIEKVTDNVNSNNEKLGVNARIEIDPSDSKSIAKSYLSNYYNLSTVSITGANYLPFTNTVNTTNTTNTSHMQYISALANGPLVSPEQKEPITPSPKIDMDNEIYKNEFEESAIVTIGNNDPEMKSTGIYQYEIPDGTLTASIGLIDSVSEDEDDLYAKLEDGEIIPFRGHQEKFSIRMETWNDLRRSDLIGDEIKKAATCHIYIDDKLARIIEDTDIQKLLMKANQAIEELKVQPFSICRDGETLLKRKIYYNNQPAIIVGIDEINNFIRIAPDTKYINNFTPPVYVIEEGESEEWINIFGNGIMIRDYDKKIWWWRDAKNGSWTNLKDDPIYDESPRPIRDNSTINQPPKVPDNSTINKPPNIPTPKKTPGIHKGYFKDNYHLPNTYKDPNVGTKNIFYSAKYAIEKLPTWSYEENMPTGLSNVYTLIDEYKEINEDENKYADEEDINNDIYYK